MFDYAAEIIAICVITAVFSLGTAAYLSLMDMVFHT